MAERYQQINTSTVPNETTEPHKPTMAERYQQMNKPTMAEKYQQLNNPKAISKNDPRSKLTKSQIAEAEANKSGAWGSFAKGFTHNFDEYAATINKGMGAIEDAIVPDKYNTGFFKDNAKYWNTKRRQNEIETEDHDTAKLAGELLIDPINLMGGGLITKGGKIARIAKSMATGAGVGFGISKSKNYGNSDLTDAKKAQGDIISAGFVSALNGVITAMTKGKVTNAIKDVNDLTGDGKHVVEATLDVLANHPEKAGLSKAEADKYSEQYKSLLESMTGRSSKLPQDYGKQGEQATSKETGNALNWVLRPNYPLSTKVTAGLLPSPNNVKPNVIHAGWKHSGETLPIEINPHATGSRGTESRAIVPPKKYVKKDGSFDWETFANEYPESRIFDHNGNQLDLPTPKPELLRNKNTPIGNREDNLEELGFTPEETAKILDDLKNKSPYSNDVDSFIENITKALNRSRSPITLEFKKLINENPLAKRALDSARERYAKLTYNQTMGGNAGSWMDNGVVKRAGAKGNKNADFDFMLTKSDINSISRGKVTPEILDKLKTDMTRFENDPMFNTELNNAEKIIGRHEPHEYNIAHDNLSTAEKTVAGEQPSLGFEGTQNPLFTPEADTRLVTPAWAKPLVNDTTRYEDIVKAVTDAKNGKPSELADRAVDEMAKDPAIGEKLATSPDGTSLFSNVGHNLAAGFGTGTVNAASGLFDGSYDPNKDLSEQMADRFIKGMAAGIVGVSGLKMLRKTNPEAFEKVRSWVMDNDVKVGDRIPDNGTQLGVFAGKKAKGFEGATGKHAGKYDKQTRFEIDDSNMKVKPKGVTDLFSKGEAKLGDVIDHNELFDNYPELKNIDVKFDKNMWGHASFDGDNTITMSNKFSSKDDIESSIIHEIQHVIQNEEGFAGGGSYDDALREVAGRIYELEKKGDLSQMDAMRYKDELTQLKGNKTDEAFERYKKIAGEIEAREVQARKNLTPEERNLIPPYENVDTMGAGGYSDEAYNSAFMAKLEGRHKDFESTGIDPKDATLDFSRSKADATTSNPNFIAPTDKKTAHLRKITTDAINKDWTDISSGLFKSLRASFSDTFSGKYIDIRDDTIAGKHNMAKRAEKIQKALSVLPEATRKQLHEYIVGDISGNTVPAQIKKIGDNMRKTVTDLQDELIAKGIYDKEDIEAWGENYLRREYQTHYGKPINIFRGGFKMPSKMRRGKVEKLTQKQFNEKVMTGEIDLNLIGKPLKDGGIEKNVIGNKIEIRRDWTKAERENMGEITDAMVTVPQTIMRLSQMVEHGKMLQKIAKLDGAVISKGEAKLATPQALHDNGFIQLERKAQYGPLSGQWVRKDVADDIGAMNATLFQQNGSVTIEAKMAWLKYLSSLKKALTVYNLPTHINNVGANPFLMQASGLNPLEIATGLGKAVKSMHKAIKLRGLEHKELIGTISNAEKTELSGLKSELKYYIEAESQGLLNTSRLEDIQVGQTQSFKKKGILGKIDNVATSAYQGEDSIAKLAMFSHLREKGWSVKEARNGTLAIMPDYNRPMSPAFRKLRDSGFTPFIAWTYYTLPKMLKLGASARGTFQISTAIAGIYGLSYALTGIGNPYSDKLPDDAHMARVPISKDGNHITTIKMDRINPFMQLLNIKKSALEMIGQGFPQTLYGVINGIKVYNQRPVTNENKPKIQQLYDEAKYASNLLPIPGQIKGGVDLIESLVRKNSNRKRSTDIVPRTTAQNLLRQIGINSLTFDTKNVEKERRKKEKKASFF